MESARSTAKSIEPHHELNVPIIVMEVHTLLHVPIPGQGQIMTTIQFIVMRNHNILHTSIEGFAIAKVSGSTHSFATVYGSARSIVRNDSCSN